MKLFLVFVFSVMFSHDNYQIRQAGSHLASGLNTVLDIDDVFKILQKSKDYEVQFRAKKAYTELSTPYDDYYSLRNMKRNDKLLGWFGVESSRALKFVEAIERGSYETGLFLEWINQEYDG